MGYHDDGGFVLIFGFDVFDFLTSVESVNGSVGLSDAESYMFLASARATS